MAGELRQLAQFVCDFHLDQTSEEVRRAARYCVLDTIGSALGAGNSKEIASIAQVYSAWAGIGTNERTAAAWCQGQRVCLFNALLINGMLSHELEMDDVHTGSKSHVGAVVVPTAWTLADALGASGHSFMEAVIVGYEVMGRVGQCMDVSSNRKRGWHTTGVIGTFGAAAAAAKLLNLSVDQTVSAFGMAGTQSSGLWAFLAEGATCKKLHPARASVNGVSACLLALGGMTGPEHILDAEDGGLYAAMSDRFDISRLCDGLGTQYVCLQIDKKPYPCCRTTHHAIDAALKLSELPDFNPADIAAVRVQTYEVGVLQCGFEKYPETPVEAKFSIKFTCAAAFVHKKVTRQEFALDVLDDPEIRRIASVTHVEADELFNSRYPKRWGSRMTVTMKNGVQHVCQIDDMSGSVSVPLSEKQEIDKFLGLLADIWPPDTDGALQQSILTVEAQKRLPELSGKVSFQLEGTSNPI